MAHHGWCGFCGKPRNAVDRLIDGPETAICNECIDLMHDMLKKPPPSEDFISIDEFRKKHGRERQR